MIFCFSSHLKGECVGTDRHGIPPGGVLSAPWGPTCQLVKLRETSCRGSVTSVWYVAFNFDAMYVYVPIQHLIV